MEAREVPTSKTTTLYKGAGKWYQRREAAYYAIARAMVCKRYPRWLDDPDLENRIDVDGDTLGDIQASAEGVANWRARRDRRVALFWTRRPFSYDDGPSGEYFDVDKFQRFVRRLAKFLAFVDSRRPA